MSQQVRILYYSQRLLEAIDLNHLVSILLQEYGERVNVEFAPMSAAEKASLKRFVPPVNLVERRIFIVEDGGEPRRRRDLEDVIEPPVKK